MTWNYIVSPGVLWSPCFLSVSFCFALFFVLLSIISALYKVHYSQFTVRKKERNVLTKGGLFSTYAVVLCFIEGASVTSENGSIVRVKEGEDVTISCIPFGVPLPNVSWNYSRTDMLEFGSTLLVPNISRDLNGSAIECSASNSCGNDSKLTYVVVQCESRLFSVKVYSRPNMTQVDWVFRQL